jgi:hypothetical protein
MLYCPCGHRFGDEVTDIFTTAGPVQAPAIDGYAGERAISALSDSTPEPPEGGTGAVARAGPLPGRSTVRDFTGGIRTRFFHLVRSIRNLHHQRWFGRKTRQTETK